VTVNVRQPVATIAPGHTGTVKVDAQRMIDGVSGFTITGTSSDDGIRVTPASGQFGADGSGAVDVSITVAPSVREDYYVVFLTTAAGETARRSVVFVIAQAEPGES
jgi:hypothetical protein